MLLPLLPIYAIIPPREFLMTGCGQCGKQFESPTGKTGGRCPDCIAANESYADWFAHLLQTKRLAVAPVLAGINVVIFLAMVLKGISPLSPSGEDLLPWGADYGPLTLGGQWWRLFASMFLHFGVIHLLLNMWCLWDLSQLAERIAGAKQFAAVYVLSGLTGSVASLWWEPEAVSAGASGAVFGIAGFLVAIFSSGRLQLPTEAISKQKNSLLTFVGYNLVYGAMRSGTSNSAHIGGLAAGLLMGALLPIEKPHKQEPGEIVPDEAARKSAGLIFGAVGVLICAGCFFVAREHRSLVAIEQARQKIEAGSFPEAIVELNAIVKAGPKSAYPYRLLGSAYVRQNQMEDAAKAFQQGIALDPTDFYSHFSLGYALRIAQKPEEAIPPLQKAISLEPKSWPAHHNLALAFTQVGRLDDAIRIFTQLIKAQPEEMDNYFGLGDAYWKKGEWQKAVDTLEIAVRKEAGPDSAPLWGLLAKGYEKLGKLEKATAAKAKSVELSNKAPATTSK